MRNNSKGSNMHTKSTNVDKKMLMMMIVYKATTPLKLRKRLHLIILKVILLNN